jgi:hypothetical protein
MAHQLSQQNNMKKVLFIILPLTIVTIIVALVFAFKLTQSSKATQETFEVPKPYNFKATAPKNGFGSAKTPSIPPEKTISTSSAQINTSSEGMELIKSLETVGSSDSGDELNSIKESASSL